MEGLGNALKAQHHFGYPEISPQTSLTSFWIYFCPKTPQQAVEFNLKIILQWVGWILTLPHNDKDQKLTLKNRCYNTKNIRSQWICLSSILISIQKKPWTSFCIESLLRAEKSFHSCFLPFSFAVALVYHIHAEMGQPEVYNGIKTTVLMIPWYLFLKSIIPFSSFFVLLSLLCSNHRAAAPKAEGSLSSQPHMLQL